MCEPGAVPGEYCTQGCLCRAVEARMGLGQMQPLGSTVPRHHGGVPGAGVDAGWGQSLGLGHLDGMAGAGVGMGQEESQGDSNNGTHRHLQP